jgi:hypothetical protein
VIFDRREHLRLGMAVRPRQRDRRDRPEHRRATNRGELRHARNRGEPPGADEQQSGQHDAGEQRDLERISDLRLLPQQDQRIRVEDRRREDRERAEHMGGRGMRLHFPRRDREHAEARDHRAEDRRTPDRLAEQHGGEEQGDQRREEGQRDALRHRHADQPPEEQQHRDPPGRPAQRMKFQRRPPREGPPLEQEHRAEQHDPDERTPQHRAIRAAGDAEALHQDVHRRIGRNSHRGDGEGQR